MKDKHHSAFNLKKSVLATTIFFPLLTITTLLSGHPSQAFTLNNSEGKIEFSSNSLEASSPIPVFGNRLPNELRSPGRDYPTMAIDFEPPAQTNTGVLQPPLSDVWNDPLHRGTASISLQAITFPTLAGIIWDNLELTDFVGDQLAARNSSYGKATFTTTVSGLYNTFEFLNVDGSIDLSQPDAWVVGSLKAKINGVDIDPIVFGFDGAGRGRKDFITANTVAIMSAGMDSFSTQGFSWFDTPGFLKEGDAVTIEGTFTCAAYNGTCNPKNFGFRNQQVPEPSTILGLGIVTGFAALLKKATSKKQPYQSFSN
ncbi:PEP-CTERM sorting domain-containing protein [Aerosakkonemataceae cyanobacterium BLCC-F50]|uniref:PEP-CTERM sorting domain-containing protein n=1 Tax=Floridaenema flaviceps BLCC-F50 TaxID=3153642 RepID=A0ABV4XIH1_9CYAN